MNGCFAEVSRVVIRPGLVGTRVFHYVVATFLGGGCFDTAPDVQEMGVRFASMSGPFLSTGFQQPFCVTIKSDSVSGGGPAQLTNRSKAFLTLFATMAKKPDSTADLFFPFLRVGHHDYRDEMIGRLESKDRIDYAARTPTSRRIMYLGTINKQTRGTFIITIHDNGKAGPDTFELIVTNLQNGSVYLAEGFGRWSRFSDYPDGYTIAICVCLPSRFRLPLRGTDRVCRGTLFSNKFIVALLGHIRSWIASQCIERVLIFLFWRYAFSRFASELK